MSLGLVDNLVSEEFQDLSFAVILRLDIEQLRIVCDKSGVALTFTECRMVQYVQQESLIGLYTLDVCLIQSTDSLAAGILECSGERRYLDQQGIVIRAYDGTCEAVASVQTDSETRCGTVLFNCTGVRSKSACRILCCYTALDLISVLLDVLLAANADLR